MPANIIPFNIESFCIFDCATGMTEYCISIDHITKRGEIIIPGMGSYAILNRYDVLNFPKHLLLYL